MSRWLDVVLLIAFLMCNFLVATTKLQSMTTTTTKDLVMYYSAEHVCRFIYLFLLVLCIMYNFVFVATTQLHSNNNNNNTNKKINLHKLLNFQSHISWFMFLLSALLLLLCNYVVIAHLSVCIHNYIWTGTKLPHNNNNKYINVDKLCNLFVQIHMVVTV